ncbi:zinc knuckle CX2CX4HX4C containing protein [Tanacetum coccineum]
MDRVLENGPWLIRMVPLILNVWSPDSDLHKAKIKKVPVWVKLHHVPIVAYSEVGLSLITTQIGKPIRLDAYTSNMCLQSWGRSAYARALIEVSAEDAPKEELVIAIPLRCGQTDRFEIRGGSSEGAGLESDVPDEPKGKSIDTSEGTCLKLRVLDVSKADSSESEYESWGDSDDNDDDDDQQGDDERTESDNDKAADLNKTDNEEEDEFVHTPDNYVPTDDENIDD